MEEDYLKERKKWRRETPSQVKEDRQSTVAAVPTVTDGFQRLAYWGE